MLDRDLFVQVDEIDKLRRTGWRPRSQVCEYCKSRAWGAGAGLQVWEAWEEGQKQKARGDLRRRPDLGPDVDGMCHGKGRATVGDNTSPNETDVLPSGIQTRNPLVVFSCRHVYHGKCLTQRLSEASHDITDDVDAASANNGQPLRCPSCH